MGGDCLAGRDPGFRRPEWGGIWRGILTGPSFECVCMCHNVSVCIGDSVCTDQSVSVNVYE